MALSAMRIHRITDMRIVLAQNLEMPAGNQKSHRNTK